MLEIVGNIQNYITISIMSNLFDGLKIEQTVKLLDLFNEGNSKKPLHERINYTVFNNDAINKEVSLKDHFTVWLQERQKAKRDHVPFDRHKVFTIACYPWILDAARKSEQIKRHSELQ